MLFALAVSRQHRQHRQQKQLRHFGQPHADHFSVCRPYADLDLFVAGRKPHAEQLFVFSEHYQPRNDYHHQPRIDFRYCPHHQCYPHYPADSGAVSHLVFFAEQHQLSRHFQR